MSCISNENFHPRSTNPLDWRCNVSNGLLERLPVSISRDWLVGQIDAIEGLTLRERIIAGRCLGRFHNEAWSSEEVAFLSDGDLSRIKEVATMALSRCCEQAPDDRIRAELIRISFWLFKPE